MEGDVEGLLAERGPRGAGQPGRPQHLRLCEEQHPRGDALQGRAHRPLPLIGRRGVRFKFMPKWLRDSRVVLTPTSFNLQSQAG